MFQSGVKKARNRVPVSCQECRKKKMKCDKQKPCSACVKNEAECIYLKDSIKPINKPVRRSNSLKTEMLRLKMKLNHAEQLLSAHGINSSPELADDGIFAKYANKDGDEHVSVLLDKFQTMIIKENAVSRLGLMTGMSLMEKDKELQSLVHPLYNEQKAIFSKYLQAQTRKASEFPVRTSSLEMMRLNGTFLNALGPSKDNKHQIFEIIAEINTLLPPAYVLNSLVDNFFEKAYHVFPFVNQDVFRDEIARVLVILPAGNANVAITHVQNTSIISLLLLVLRFAHLSNDNLTIFGFDSFESNRYPELAQKLLESITGIESVENKFDIRTIQVYLFLKLIELYAPDKFSTLVHSTMTTNKLISMARVVGIFKDPSFFENSLIDHRQFDVIRRIAFKLFLMDWQSSLETGAHLTIFDKEMDINLPQLSTEEKEVIALHKSGLPTNRSIEEIKRLILENDINSNIALEYEVSLVIRKVFNIVQLEYKSTTKKQLFDAILEVERFSEKNVPHIYDMIRWSNSPTFSFVRTINLRASILQFLVTVLFNCC